MLFETDRLVMSKISNDDAENLVTVLSDPDVMKYSTVGVHTEKQILAYIANCQLPTAIPSQWLWTLGCIP